MPASASDIVVTLTGGSNNSNPIYSIGGNPSSYPVTGTLNNLFDNISDLESQTGKIDYRCVYVFNNSSFNTIYNVQLYTTYLTDVVSNIQIGINSKSEIQRLIINGSITNGSFQISYKPPTQDTVEYRNILFDSDPAIWALNLKNELLTIPTINEIEISISGTYTSRIFDINFNGIDDKRNHDLLGINTSGLIGSEINGFSSKLTQGGPINSIPTLLDVSTTVPYDINFYDTNNSTMLSIGNLYPEEGFPLWIKRTVPENAISIAGEGFKLKILGSPI